MAKKNINKHAPDLVESSEESTVLLRRFNDEHARTGSLSIDRVLAVCERREVPSPVVAEIRAQLTHMGLLPAARADPVTGWLPPANDEDRPPPPIDILGLYLREIGKHPLLMAEDERRLGRRIRAGRARLETLLGLELDCEDEPPHPATGHFLRRACQLDGISDQDKRILADGADAEDQLYLSNLRLVVSLARKIAWHHSKLEPLDIVQAGNIGLVRAVQKFDHTLGYKFSTYATWWIRQAIDRHVGNSGRTIRLPVHLGDQIRRSNRCRVDLATQLERQPTLLELAHYMDIDPADLQFSMDCAATTASIDKVVRPGSSTTVGDLLIDESANDPADVVEQQFAKKAIDDVLHQLSEREREVVRMRFGLDGIEPKTLREVGEHFNVSGEAVRRMQARALVKLRDPDLASQLHDYLEDAIASDGSAADLGEPERDSNEHRLRSELPTP
jgi:RNA polymerase primary sigma factor